MSSDQSHNRPSASDGPQVTVAVADGALRKRLVALLEESGISVAARSDETSLDQSSHDSDVVFVSRSEMPPDATGMIEDLGRDDPDAAGFVVLSEDADPQDHVDLVAAGATKVLNPDQPSGELRDALAAVTFAESSGASGAPEGRGREAKPRLVDFYSPSGRMREFMEIVRRILDVDSPLLISGETGVGKERLARAIHAEGPRAERPFVSVNLGAIPENLVEAELFGHEKGAFTGAQGERAGPFEQAQGGTVFLDEIGEMPLQQQVKLLTVLQRHEVQRIGATQATEVEVRVIAATNRDLWEEVKEQRFRPDLYYRLNVVPLLIPPLRERPDDLPDLIGRFLHYTREDLGRSFVKSVSAAAMDALLSYPWPGNIRELINAIEHAVLLSDGEEVPLSALPDTVLHPDPNALPSSTPAGGAKITPTGWRDRPWKEVREEAVRNLEREYLDHQLRECAGRIDRTSERAGLQPRSLHEKMRRHGLKKEDYR